MPLVPPKVRLDEILVDRCYDDPELDDARVAVADPARPAGERAATALRVVLSRRADTERQLLAQEVLAEAAHDVADDLQRQATAELSGLDGSEAVGLAAAARVAAAWRVRGRGRAETVDPDSMRRFAALLEAADELALTGLRTVPDSPGCALARLGAGRGRGVPDDDLMHRSEVARRRDPLCVPAHLQTLQTVCDKWYGSHESMFDLVRQSLALAPPGHPVTAVLPVAHLEYMAAGEPDAEERRRRDLVYVRPLSDALLAAGDQHPRAREAHSAFGWFLAAAGVPDAARAHLARVGLRPGWHWGYLDEDPRLGYLRVLRGLRAAR